jgi:hypothetical protein
MSDDFTPEPVAEAPAPEAPTTDDGFAPGEGDSFATPAGDKVYTESYVKKLREEAAKYRVEAKTVKEKFSPFEGMDEADLGWFFDAANTYRTGGVDSLASYVKPLFESLVADGATPKEAAEVVEQAVEQADAQDKPLTQADIDRLLEEKLAARSEQERVNATAAKIDATLAEAGYKKGSVEYITVLTYATENRLPIERAIADMEASKQLVIDEYVKGKKSAPRTVSGTPGEETPAAPTNIREAAKMADAWLASRAAAG